MIQEAWFLIAVLLTNNHEWTSSTISAETKSYPSEQACLDAAKTGAAADFKVYQDKGLFQSTFESPSKMGMMCIKGFVWKAK